MESVLEPLKEFSKNSLRLVKRCTKPDRRGISIVLVQNESPLKVLTMAGQLPAQLITKQWRWLEPRILAGMENNSMCLPFAEFNKICLQTALGFIVMGFIGFFVKLVFIVSTHHLLYPRGYLSKC